eukprot:509345_1
MLQPSVSNKNSNPQQQNRRVHLPTTASYIPTSLTPPLSSNAINLNYQNEVAYMQHLVNVLMQQCDNNQSMSIPIIKSIENISNSNIIIATQQTSGANSDTTTTLNNMNIRSYRTIPQFNPNLQSVSQQVRAQKIGCAIKGQIYKCNVCFKSFTNKYQMVTHKNIHNSLKPFVCTVCNTSFSSKSLQIKHMKQNHPMIWETIKHRYCRK